MNRREVLRGIAASLASAAVLGGTPDAESGESRAILNEGFNWLDRTQADRMLERIAGAGFNALITCVWHGSGTTWPSRVAPVIEQFPGGDPFAYLLEAATRRGIELHAWFTVALRQREFLDSWREPGTPNEKFEVHVPAFRNFITATMLEFVERYPVQGLHLDYIRAGGISQSSTAIADYARLTGRSLAVDRLLPTAEASAAIAGWQEGAVGEIVRRVARGARSARPGVVLSVSAAPWYAPYLAEGQDSVRWVNEGSIDVLCSMNYQDVLDVPQLLSIAGRLRRPTALVPIVSNYLDRDGPTRPRPAGAVTHLIEQARSVSRGGGVALYLYSMLSDGQIATLRGSVFAHAARPTWRAAQEAPTKAFSRGRASPVVS